MAAQTKAVMSYIVLLSGKKGLIRHLQFRWKFSWSAEHFPDVFLCSRMSEWACCRCAVQGMHAEQTCHCLNNTVFASVASPDSDSDYSALSLWSKVHDCFAKNYKTVQKALWCRKMLMVFKCKWRVACYGKDMHVIRANQVTARFSSDAVTVPRS